MLCIAFGHRCHHLKLRWNGNWLQRRVTQNDKELFLFKLNMNTFCKNNYVSFENYTILRIRTLAFWLEKSEKCIHEGTFQTWPYEASLLFSTHLPCNFQYFDQKFENSFRLPYQTTQNYVVSDGTKSMGILPVVETMDYSKS